MLTIDSPILSIFLLIITGYTLKQCFIQDKVFWNLSETLTYNLLSPLLFALVVNKADFSKPGIATALIATIVATLTIAIIIFLTKLIVKVDDSLFISIFQGGLRPNSYIFLAISSLLYDEVGLTVAGVFVACTLVLSNLVLILVTIHHSSCSRKKAVVALKAIVKNPLILGTTIGLALNLLDFHFSTHSITAQYLHYLGNAATPLNLLSIGAGFNFAIKWEKVSIMAYISSLKLLIMPFCTVLILKFFGATGVVTDIAILYSAVPCAANSYTICRSAGGDTEVMNAITTWTTIVSLATMSFLISTAK